MRQKKMLCEVRRAIEIRVQGGGASSHEGREAEESHAHSTVRRPSKGCDVAVLVEASEMVEAARAASPNRGPSRDAAPSSGQVAQR